MGQSQRIPTRGPGYRPGDQRLQVGIYTEGNTLAYEQANFTTGLSPTVIDFGTDSGGRICHVGYFINDGPGDIRFEFSNDGINYGGLHTMKPNEQLDLSQYSIKKIRLTWVENSGYRILCA